jgi:regulator of RNase E activity RraA
LRDDQPAMVGIAYTMRFIPSREDKDGPTSTNRSMIQPQAMEECPPGHVLMIDSRGDSRAASAGDLYIGRLKARGAAGVVTDGGFRDTNGVFKTGCRPITAGRRRRRRRSRTGRSTCSCRSPAAASRSIPATSWSATATPCW